MRAAAYRGYARHYGRNRRARHRNRGRAASAEPRRDDPDRNRRIERPPTPCGDHIIALDSFATPAAVERPSDVISTAGGPIAGPGTRDHPRSEERRGGKESVSRCGSRWQPYHKKKK